MLCCINIRDYAYLLKLEEISTDIEKQDAPFRIIDDGLNVRTPSPSPIVTLTTAFPVKKYVS